MTTNASPVMPAQLQTLWHALKPEVLTLHARWLIYRQLFGTSPQRVDLLNATAPTFFLVVDDALFESIQLGIVKLGDPAKSQRNLTLESLLNELQPQDSKLLKKLRKSLDKYRKECSKLRRIRNKRLAHIDRMTLLGKNPLTNSSRNEIETALATLRDFLNSLAKHFGEPEMASEQMILRDDGNDLAEALKRSLRYLDLLTMGIIDFTDIQKSPFYKT